MRGQIRGLSQAQRNMQNGLSVLESEDASLHHISSTLQRMRELTVQMSTDTVSDNDRLAAQKELGQLLESVGRHSRETRIQHSKNTGNIRPLYIHVGSNAGQTFHIDTVNVSTSQLGLANVKLTTREKAEELITKIDDAQTIISRHLTNTGADYEALIHHNETLLYKKST